MRERPPLVKDATDEGQQGNAEQLIRQQERVEVDDLRWLLSNKQGRRLAWRLLEQCGIHESVTHRPSQAGYLEDEQSRVFYNAGQQDLGHWLELALASADEGAFLVMQQEAMQRAKKFDATVEAGHTESSAAPGEVAFTRVGMDGVEHQVEP